MSFETDEVLEAEFPGVTRTGPSENGIIAPELVLSSRMANIKAIMLQQESASDEALFKELMHATPSMLQSKVHQINLLKKRLDDEEAIELERAKKLNIFGTSDEVLKTAAETTR